MWTEFLLCLSLVISGCSAANPCDDNPCKGGGTCTSKGSSFSCACPDGYQGSACQYASCDPLQVSQSIGYNPILRSSIDGSQQWTMVQTEGFPTAGILTGFKFYVQNVRSITIGLYRPLGGCSFSVINLWTPEITDFGVYTHTLTKQVKFQANDTIGITWTQYGTIPYEPAAQNTYCEDNVSPAVGSNLSLKANRYGNRVYSIKALYTTVEPVSPGPTLGFSPLARGAVDGSQIWTMVQTTGFATAGRLVGFRMYFGFNNRQVRLGLYRPVGGCTFTLLKAWTSPVSAIGISTIWLPASDQADYLAGDTIGLTWTSYGAVSYEGSSEYNYCDKNVGQPAVGNQVTLDAGKYGNRMYSLQAITKPVAVDFCSNNPCLNGGQCCNTGANFTCQCPPGTVAPVCAKATSCNDNPCINGGTCVTVTKTTYSCKCIPGYGGNNCEIRPCDDNRGLSIGYTPMLRGLLDGTVLQTVVQTQGFPAAGIVSGFRFYVQTIGPIQIGLYRPKGGCKFTLLKAWTPGVTNIGVNQILLSSAERANFQAGDTIGFTWTNRGVISYDDVKGFNYCEDIVGRPAIGATLSLVAGRRGNRIYSFESLYIPNGPSLSPMALGYSYLPRGVVDGSIRWTFVQIDGFQTAGTIIGFNFYVGAVRPVQLGLYRPLSGTCSYKLLKSWTPDINSLGVAEVVFTGSDQANFQVGDTIGFTWTNYGSISYETSTGDYNYCEGETVQPAVGSAITLKAGRYGNRFYSIQALYTPAVSASTCVIPTGCSPNPCLNGGDCESTDSDFSCTCKNDYSGDRCEIPPPVTPCSIDSIEKTDSAVSTSQTIGYRPIKRLTTDGSILWTFVQTQGFPTAGILTGFKFFANFVRPITVGIYRRVNGCTFTLRKSWSPNIVAVGEQTLQLSDSQRFEVEIGDTIGFTWTKFGVISYEETYDYAYCEDSKAPPAIGSDFTLLPGRYGRRYYSIQAFYNPTRPAPLPLSLGFTPVKRGAVDGSRVWTFVQQLGFETNGELLGFQFYAQAVRPIQIGIYRPVAGCSFVLLKSYTPWVANVGFTTVFLSEAEKYTFQKGDTIGFTWTELGVIAYEDSWGSPYCENNVAPTTEGTIVSLIANRYGNRVYSLKALYKPTSTTGFYVDYCSASPCLNGGTCCSTTSSFRCTCPANTILPFCNNADPCASSPCKYGGQCTKISTTTYSCQCKLGYSGDSCEEVVPDPCDAKPCKNGGACTRLDNTNYSCKCTSAYYGDKCQTAIPPCSSSPCKNGAACVETGGTSFSCQCKIGFSGSSCGTVVPNPCDAKPCLNGGTCTRLDNTNYQCQCTAQYLGDKCQTVVQPCSSSPCKNGGTCSSTGGTNFSCKCKLGYSGSNCDTVIPDPCATKPCLNDGSCTRLDNTNFQCQCTSKYFGDKCQTAVPPCSSSPCKNGATCVESGDTGFTCQCEIGYSGPNCDTVVPNPCNPSPCKNSGKCTRLSNTAYSCQCPSGYDGTNCEIALPCLSSPCQNGGTCNNVGTTDFECICPNDYNDGDVCSEYQDPCVQLKGTCLNGGTCVRVSWEEYSCTCPGQYLGKHCELEHDKAPCENQPCQNGGKCTEVSETEYKCTCTSQWEGEICNVVHCLKDTEPCSQLSYGKYAQCGNCKNFVACRPKVNKTKVKTCSKYPYFDRRLRKCTTDQATACDGL